MLSRRQRQLDWRGCAVIDSQQLTSDRQRQREAEAHEKKRCKSKQVIKVHYFCAAISHCEQRMILKAGAVRQFKHRLRREFDIDFALEEDSGSGSSTDTPSYPPRQLFRHVNSLMWFFDVTCLGDTERLVALAKSILFDLSPSASSHAQSYIALAMTQGRCLAFVVTSNLITADVLVRWIGQAGKLLSLCSKALAHLPPGRGTCIGPIVHLLLTLTDHTSWKICQGKADSQCTTDS